MADTPDSTHCYGKNRKIQLKLAGHAQLASWPTPTAALADKSVRSEAGGIMEAMRSKGPDLAAVAYQVHLTSGTIPTSSLASTEKRGALNAAFSAWLQGYPVAWCQAAIRAHRKLKQRRKHGP